MGKTALCELHLYHGDGIAIGSAALDGLEVKPKVEI